MPAMIVSVSQAAVADAQQAGFSNPARAAALIRLDQTASSMLGGRAWRDNSYAGYVTYKTGIGSFQSAVIVYEEKDCNQNAIDKEPAPNPPYGGGGGSGGGGGGGGAYNPHFPSLPPPGCYGAGCYPTGTVEVGEIGQP